MNLNSSSLAVFRALLGLLLNRLSLPKTPERLKFIERLDETALSTPDSVWPCVGVKAQPVSLSLVQAREYASSSHLLVAQFERDTATGETAWLVLCGSVGHRMQVVQMGSTGMTEYQWSVGELASMLGIPEDKTWAWWSIEPLAPLDAAASHHDEEHEHLDPFRRLLRLLQPERQDIVIVTVFAFGVGLLGLATPVAVQALVNSVAMGGVLQPVIVLAVMLFLFLGFSGAIQIFRTYLVEIVQRRIFIRVAADLAWRMPRVRREIYDKRHGAELVNRFFDVLTVQKAGASLLLEGVATVLQTGIGLVVLGFYHPFLLAFDLLLLIAISLIIAVLGRGAVATAIDESRCKYALVAWLEETAYNLVTFKSSGGPELALARADALGHAYLEARHGHFRILLRQTVGAVFLQATAGTALLALGGMLVVEKQLSLGQLVAAELIVSTVLAGFVKFGKQLENYYDLLAAVDKLGHLLDLPAERQAGTSGQPLKDQPIALSLHQVGFSYPGHPKAVLADLDLHLAAGETLAVLGGPGSGKSTLAELIVGLRDPSSGRIEFNGFDQRDIRLEALREQVALVGNIEMIADTVWENVRLGRDGVSHETVIGVLDRLGLSQELVIDLPDRLQTELGPSGSPLSTGQARRVMLARALVGKPGLLILDAVLDDMDEASVTQLWPTLSGEAATRSLLILTRQPLIAARCDRIVRLGEGDSP
ncbi:MAG: peptidase domain-containing ABC transporter [Methylococcaceae bacterium]